MSLYDMRVWVVSKEADLDLTDEQINGWRNFLDLAMAKGCLRTTLAEDSERIIAVSYWPSQEVLDSVVNSEAYEKVGEKTSVITSDAFARVLVALFEDIATSLSSADELS